MARCTIKIEFQAGENIENAFKKAIRVAKTLDCHVEFRFNGVTCLAHSTSKYEHGVAEYFRMLKGDRNVRTAFA